jgi:hypothetical protein
MKKVDRGKGQEGYQETNGAAVATPQPPKVEREKAKAARPPIEPVTTDPAPHAGLHLAPEDWLFATWRRPRTLRQRPPAPPFTLEDGMARFARMCSKSSYRHD